MVSVLISYMSDDFEAVAALADNVAANGADVWMDKHSMMPGQPWAEQFPAKLAECDVVLSVFSQSIFPLRERPFIDEQRLIDLQLKKHPRLRFIPVRISRVEKVEVAYDNLPLEALHCIDLFGNDLKMLQIQFERLFKALGLDLHNVPRPLPSRLIVRCAHQKKSFDGTVRGLDICIDGKLVSHLQFGTTKVFNVAPGKCSLQALVDIRQEPDGGDALGFEVFSKSKVLPLQLAPFSSTVIEISVQNWVSTNTISEAYLFKWLARAAGLLPRYSDRDTWPEGVAMEVIA